MISAYMVGHESFTNRLRGLSGNIGSEVEKSFLRVLIKLQRIVKGKLSDDVLHVRTGTLRRSINYSVRGEGAGTLIGTVGTNVSYARVHEYGFDGTVNVREHLRKLKSQGSVTVRAHQRTVHIPERSFLRSALAEILPEFKLEMQDAVRRAGNI